MLLEKTKVKIKVKIKVIEDKIPDISLTTNTTLNAKINEVKLRYLVLLT